MAKKAVKRAVKKAAPKPKTEPKPKTGPGPGRPKGSTKFHTDTIAVRKFFPFANVRSKEKLPGLRRIVLEVSTPEYALALETLASVAADSPEKILNWAKRQK